LRIATSPWVILGLAIYASGTFFWLVALSRVELSFAYPFASLSYVLILAASWAFLGETVSLLRLAGVVTICLGVLIVSQS
jgi:drug/metabolite transporter (DMT)-like permease